MMDFVDCSYCEHINLSEWEQIDNGVPHFCCKYNERVFHRNSIFNLHPCKKCKEDNYKNFKEKRR